MHFTYFADSKMERMSDYILKGFLHFSGLYDWTWHCVWCTQIRLFQTNFGKNRGNQKNVVTTVKNDSPTSCHSRRMNFSLTYIHALQKNCSPPHLRKSSSTYHYYIQQHVIIILEKKKWFFLPNQWNQTLEREKFISFSELCVLLMKMNVVHFDAGVPE